MSSGLTFWSSPFQSHSHFMQMDTSIFTPQPQPFKAFLPSPLRTSRNANAMSNPFATQTGKYSVSDSAKEDRTNTEDAQNIESSKTGFFLDTTSHVASDASLRASKFQYESRARSSSPSVQLQTHMTATRDSRKKVFLDRLRHKRDDARFERNGEQILRIDWLNERKAWEQEMSQNGSMHEDEDMEEADEGQMMDQASFEAMSPTEDKELEELVSYFEQAPDDEFDDNDEDYDALFMEVLGEDGAQADRSNTQRTTDVEMT